MSRFDAASVDLLITEDIALLSLPRGTRLLYIEGLVWSRAHRTDGGIPRGALRRLTDESDPDTAAAALVEVGAWQETESGWRIVDYPRLQLMKEAVEREQAATALRWDRYRERQAVPSSGAARTLDDGAAPHRTNATSPSGASPRRVSADHKRASKGGRKKDLPTARTTESDARTAPRSPNGARVASHPTERRWKPDPSRLQKVGDDPGPPEPNAPLVDQLTYAVWPLRVTVNGQPPPALVDDLLNACELLGPARMRYGVEEALERTATAGPPTPTMVELIELALLCAARAPVLDRS